MIRVPPNYDYYLHGNANDAATTPKGGLMLSGGGGDIDDAYRWFVGQANGGDIVVLRASGDGDYGPYMAGLGAVDSVETFVTHNRLAAFDPVLLEKVRNAEGIFIAGGDQSNYVKMWKGTPLEAAINERAAAGAVIGGTSAGLAVMGEFCFSARAGSLTSPDVLSDARHPNLTLDTGFLEMPHMEGIITDSHFTERGRLGRLLGFMANVQMRGWAQEVHAIGVDESTAVLVDASGECTVSGHGRAWFLKTPGLAEWCLPRYPLEFHNVPAQAVPAGGHFNLPDWSTEDAEESFLVTAHAGSLEIKKAPVSPPEPQAKVAEAMVA